MANPFKRIIGMLRAQQGEINPATYEPADPEELIQQGNACEDAGDYVAASGLYQHAVAVAPELERAHLNLGNAFSRLGRVHPAIQCYQRAIELTPDFLPAHLNLGAIHLRQGDFAEAEKAYNEAVRLAPESAQAWTGLGCALDEAGSPKADVALKRALALEPQHAGAASRLAQWLRGRGRAQEALDLLDGILRVAPDDAMLLRAVGDIRNSVGDYVLARAAFARIRAGAPQDWGAWDNELWALNFMPEATTEQILAEHRAFGEALARSLPAAGENFTPHQRQRLKIGYVSADFRRHSVACFIEPLLQHHDRNRFEIHCFYNFPSGDDVTQRLHALAEHWHDIAGASDDEVARQVRNNGIDILVDLAGHTALNRLGVFARKPAPLQCTWLGYLCTTGLATMDGRLCDAITDPPGVSEGWQVEQPWRVSPSQWCYQPQVELPEPSALPMAKNGYWTFGSFNQESKLNSGVLNAWARVLLALPGSRLRIVGITCDVVESRIREAFTGHKLASDRIEIIGRLPIDAYLAAYRDVDIALDTFPYNGATTTCDALLMGVPVAAIAGDRAIARGGASLLTAVGLTDWIAAAPDDLVSVMKAQTANPRNVEILRQQLSGRMRASALMDGGAFTRQVEMAFSRAWERPKPE